MNKFRHLFFLCVMLVSSVALTSCLGGDDDDNPSPTTKEGMLTAGTWNAKSLISEGTTYPLSGTIRFNSNGTYSANFDGDNETGTWELTQGGDYLSIDDEEIRIKKLDSKNLHLYDEEWDEEVRFAR